MSKISDVPCDGLVPSKRIIFERTVMYSLKVNFHSVSPVHTGLPRNYTWEKSSILVGVIRNRCERTQTLFAILEMARILSDSRDSATLTELHRERGIFSGEKVNILKPTKGFHTNPLSGEKGGAFALANGE